MGYGHQRAAYPLLEMGGNEVITINSYEGISRLKKIPLLGSLVFSVMDAFQKIQPRYPYRDLTPATIQQRYFYKWIKKGVGRALIEQLNRGERLPFVTTFFVAAQIAEYHNYQGDIYCIICDTDASRAWAPLEPASSRIKFLVPSEEVKKRFQMYGVVADNIMVSGFPLPSENIGQDKSVLKGDLFRRLQRLDPKNVYRERYAALIAATFDNSPEDKSLPVTITYAVGGAGAQKEIGATIVRRLASQIKNGLVAVNLVAGSRPEVKIFFEDSLRTCGLYDTYLQGKGVSIVFAPEKNDYFSLFNQCLHDTDILWTKPSELSFYAALGLPVIMSSPVGSQEDFNREWLLEVGSGIDSGNPEYVDEWLPALLNSGRLARAAVDGYLNAEQMGVYNIERLIISQN